MVSPERKEKPALLDTEGSPGLKEKLDSLACPVRWDSRETLDFQGPKVCQDYPAYQEPRAQLDQLGFR